MANILNYTTKVDQETTKMEIERILVRHGARRVGLTYGEDQQPTGLDFTLQTPVGARDFHLRVPMEGVRAVLTAQAKKRPAEARYATDAQAVRVAWRILKDWVEAQSALIEAGIATLDQVMMFSLMLREGTTLYQAFLNHETGPQIVLLPPKS